MKLFFTPKKIFILLLSVLFFSVMARSILAIEKITGAPAGYTNAPGDLGNCTSCHDGILNSGPGILTIDVGGGQTEYIPGQTYLITITIVQSTISRFGFEIVALKDSDH